MPTFSRSAAALSCVLLTGCATTFSPARAWADAAATPKIKIVDHQLDADLRAAVTAKDAAKVHRLLSRDADPNLKDTDAFATPMLGKVAGESDNLEIAQALVEAGANLEAGNTQNATPLALACVDGHLEIIKYLLRKGANIEANGFVGLTPLMLAASAGETETVRVLMAAGANVNARSDTNGTPLIYGCGKTVAGVGKLEIIQMLVNAGADGSVTATNGKNAIMIAEANGLTDIGDYLRTIDTRDRALFNAVRKIYNERQTTDSSTRTADWQAVKDALASGANPRAGGYSPKLVTPLMFLAFNLPDADDATIQQIIAHSDLNAQEQDFGATALHAAADGNYVKMIDWLVKTGARLDIKSKKGQTPLDLAIANKRTDAIAALRKAGATENPLAVDANGFNALMQLVGQKPFDSARATALLKVGVDINATNKTQETALILAAKSSASGTVNFLLINGAKPDFADSEGMTALMFGAGLASGDDALAIVTALVASKADVNLKDKKGRDALFVARGSFNSRAADVLVKAGAADKSSTRNAASSTTSLDNTKLMNAVIEKPFDAVAAASLLKTGEKIDATNFANETALMMAATAGSPDAVKWLIAKGAKVDLVDIHGQSALMNGASLVSDDDALAIVAALVAAGADVNLKDRDGATALSLAQKNYNLDAAKALVKAGAKGDGTSAVDSDNDDDEYMF